MKALVKCAPMLLFTIFGLQFGTSLLAFAIQEDVQPIRKVDQSFHQAVLRSDKAALATILDRQFEWTNVEGRTRTTKESLQDLADLKAADETSSDIKALHYGKVGFVSGIEGDKSILRVWVRRPAGWRVFNYIETPIKAKASLPAGGGTCDNPCKTLPYTATTEMDRLILDAWQKTKNDEWHPNATDWALHVADEFVIINDHTSRTKTERVDLLAKQREKGVDGAPGDPIESIRMFDFGPSAAIMLSQHIPYHGGKPYYNVRVWILRDGRWQLAISQQTTILSAAFYQP